jgi:hypothetical protein
MFRTLSPVRWVMIAGALLVFVAIIFFQGPERPASRPIAVQPEPPTAPATGPAAIQADSFAEWQAEYLRAPDPRHEAVGIELVRQRRERMKALIQSDPARALAEAIPFDQRQQLPAAVVALLETPVSGRGFYGVRVANYFAEGRAEIKREAVMGGHRYQAFVYGRRVAQPSRDNVSLHGVAVDDVIALSEDPVRELTRAEVAARLAAREKSSGACPVSNQPIEPAVEQPAVDVGGELVFLCSGGHIRVLNDELIAQEGSSGGGINPGGPVVPGWTWGPTTLLYIRAQFPDKLGDPQTEENCYSMIEGMNAFFMENSYGATYVIPTVTPLITLPFTEEYYKSIDGDIRLLGDARAAAREIGYDTNQYDWDVVRYAGGPGSFSGQAYVGAKGCWMKSSGVGVAAHEHGHNLGLWHANFWTATGDSVIGPGSNSEYGNSFDTMGAASAGNNHFNAAFKNQLGWLPHSNVTTVADSGYTNRIYAFDQPNLDPASRYALKIFKDPVRNYWVELRQKFTTQPWIFNGVQLNWSPWTESAGGTHLLDTTPGTPDAKNDAAVVVGRTFTDPVAGLHITPVAKIAGTPAAMDVVVNLGAFPGNQPPTLSLNPSATAVAANTPVTLTATATDPDGDPLAYWWDFGDRTVGSNTAVAVKSWSATGDYVVRCVASDLKGGTRSESVVITVGTPSTFRVTGQVLADGAPVADARVFVTSASTVLNLSNTDGSYTLTGLGAGTYNVTAAKWGHRFPTNSVTVGPSASSINFTSNPLPFVTLEAPDNIAAEGGDTAKLIIRRTGPTVAPLDVRYYRGGTAGYSSDYTNSPAPVGGSPYTITIPAGTNAVELTLHPISSGGAAEPLETALFSLWAHTNTYAVGATGTAIIHLFDSTANTAVLRTLESAALETADSIGVWELTVSTPPPTNVIAHYQITGTASNGLDYVSLPGTVLLPAGATTARIRVVPVTDDLLEGSETVTVTLTSVAGYTLGSPTAGAVTIADLDQTTVNLTVLDAAAAETGPDTASFLLTRDGPTNAALRVYYSIGGTALHGTDYLRLPGSVLLPAGETNAVVLITPVDDDLGEWNQTVILQLTGRAEYRLGPNRTGTVTITDNDLPLIGVTATDGYAGENSNPGTFRLHRAGSQGGTVTVHYSLTGTASNGVDYVLLTTTVTLAASSSGLTTANLTVTPIDDALAEDEETVILHILPSPNYTVDVADHAVLQLRDNDLPTVSVTASNQTVSEASTTLSNRFYFWRSSTTGSLTVNYELTGTAANGTDHSSLPGSLTFADGNATAAAVFLTLQDTLAEGNETVTLRLLPDVAYSRSLAHETTVLITDDDTNALKVNFATASSSGSEAVTNLNLLVTLSAATNVPVTVNYAFSSGSASGRGVDFTLPTGTLTYPPGVRSNFIALGIVDDTRPEPNETLAIILSNPIHASLGTTTTHTYTILDNDFPAQPTITIVTGVSTNLETAGAVPILLALDNAATNIVTATLAATAGTATGGADYTLPVATVQFPTGSVTRTFYLHLLDDALAEFPETVTLTMTGAVNGVIGAAASHTATLLDDDAVTVTWVGGVDTNWDTATANWSGGSGIFAPSNLVRFVDAGVVRSNVFIQPAGVEPLSLTVSNATKTFTFTGGDIVGATMLTKEAAGTLSLSNYLTSLSFAGGTVARGGVIEFVPGTNEVTLAFGAGPVTLSNATFRFKPMSVASGEVSRLVTPFRITASSGTLSFGRHLNHPKIAFGGPVTLERATLWLAGLDGNGGGAVDHHVLEGPLQIAGTNLLRRITNHAGANLALAGDLVDGAQPGTLVLSNSVDKILRILGTNNTYSGHTIIGNDGVADNYTTFNRAIEVGTNSALGTGPVLVQGGGFLALHGAGNLPSNATLTILISGTASGTVWSAAHVTNTVTGLNLNGVNQPRGVYTASNAPGALFGAGAIRVWPLTNATPAVLLASPSDGAEFSGPTNLTLTATVSDPDSATVTVEFRGDATPLGTVTHAPYSLIWSNAPVGTHALTAIATDELGAASTAAVVQVTVTEIPTVTVAATAAAAEFGLVPGAFTVARTGNTTDAVTVYYQLSGTASNGVDYVSLPGTVDVAAGATNVVIAVTPLADALAEGLETAILTLQPAAGYGIGAAGDALVHLLDLPVDDWRFGQFSAAELLEPTVSGDGADPEADGLANLLEYALGLDPHVADAAGQPAAGLTNGFLTLTFTRVKSAVDVALEVEVTGQMGAGWTNSTTVVETVDHGATETITTRDEVPMSAAPSRFIRLKATRP